MYLKKILLIAVCFCIMGCSSISYRKTSLSNLVTGTCKVMNIGGGYGSGFFIDDETVVTAAHIVSYGVSNIVLHDDTVVEVIKCSIHESADIAIIKVNEVFGVHKFKINKDELELGDEITAIGNPVDHKNFISFGRISNLKLENPYVTCWNTNLILCDIDGGPGSSGCVVVDEDYEVIGIIVGGPYRNITTITYILPIEHLEELLDG